MQIENQNNQITKEEQKYVSSSIRSNQSSSEHSCHCSCRSNNTNTIKSLNINEINKSTDINDNNISSPNNIQSYPSNASSNSHRNDSNDIHYTKNNSENMDNYNKVSSSNHSNNSISSSLKSKQNDKVDKAELETEKQSNKHEYQQDGNTISGDKTNNVNDHTDDYSHRNNNNIDMNELIETSKSHSKSINNSYNHHYEYSNDEKGNSKRNDEDNDITNKIYVDNVEKSSNHEDNGITASECDILIKLIRKAACDLITINSTNSKEVKKEENNDISTSSNNKKFLKKNKINGQSPLVTDSKTKSNNIDINYTNTNNDNNNVSYQSKSIPNEKIKSSATLSSVDTNQLLNEMKSIQFKLDNFYQIGLLSKNPSFHDTPITTPNYSQPQEPLTTTVTTKNQFIPNCNNEFNPNNVNINIKNNTPGLNNNNNDNNNNNNNNNNNTTTTTTNNNNNINNFNQCKTTANITSSTLNNHYIPVSIGNTNSDPLNQDIIYQQNDQYSSQISYSYQPPPQSTEVPKSVSYFISLEGKEPTIKPLSTSFRSQSNSNQQDITVEEIKNQNESQNNTYSLSQPESQSLPNQNHVNITSTHNTVTNTNSGTCQTILYPIQQAFSLNKAYSQSSELTNSTSSNLQLPLNNRLTTSPMSNILQQNKDTFKLKSFSFIKDNNNNNNNTLTTGFNQNSLNPKERVSTFYHVSSSSNLSQITNDNRNDIKIELLPSSYRLQNQENYNNRIHNISSHNNDDKLFAYKVIHHQFPPANRPTSTTSSTSNINNNKVVESRTLPLSTTSPPFVQSNSFSSRFNSTASFNVNLSQADTQSKISVSSFNQQQQQQQQEQQQQQTSTPTPNLISSLTPSGSIPNSITPTPSTVTTTPSSKTRNSQKKKEFQRYSINKLNYLKDLSGSLIKDIP